MTRWLPRIAALLSLAGLVGVLGAAQRYADGDMGHLIAVEVRLAQLLRAGELGAALQYAWALVAPQPPLGYLPGVVGFALFGFRPWIAVLVMGLVLALVWDALERLWGERAWLGWAAVLASPFVWVAVEQHSRDLAAAAAVLQTLSWWHRSEGFAERRGALGFGAWLGIGFMTKYTFPIFAAFLCLGAGLDLLRQPRRERWKNLGFAVLAFLAVAGAWYAAAGGKVLRYVGFSFGDEMQGHTANFRDPTTLESRAYYPVALLEAFTWPGAVLVGAALVAGLARRPTRARVALGLLACAGGLGTLSTLPEAVDRYALPAFVLLCAALPALPDGPRRGLLPALVGLVLVPVAVATGARFWPDAPTTRPTYEHRPAQAQALGWPAPAAYRPSDLRVGAWNLDQVARALYRAQGGDRGTIGVLSGSGPDGGPTFATLTLAAARFGLGYDYATIGDDPRTRQPVLFLGPLMAGDRPARRFTTLVAFRPPAGNAAADRFLATRPATVVATVPGPDGATTTVYQLAADPALQTPP